MTEREIQNFSTNGKMQQLVGKTLHTVLCDEVNNEIEFYATTGEKYKMYHQQECCESVVIDDINGDLNDLVGRPILKAECNYSDAMLPKNDMDDSFTWTFFDIATVKGNVTIKWYGDSNGYYSETADFDKI